MIGRFIVIFCFFFCIVIFKIITNGCLLSDQTGLFEIGNEIIIKLYLVRIVNVKLLRGIENCCDLCLFYMWHMVIFILLFTFSNECYNY